MSRGKIVIPSQQVNALEHRLQGGDDQKLPIQRGE